MQHRLVRVVAEGHVGEAHVAAQQGQSAVGRGDRLLLGLHRHLAGRALELFCGLQRPRTVVADLALPCPVAGLVVDFGHGAAILAKFHVHERHGALVFLDGLIHQLEDTGGTGERHHHHGQLLRDLTDRVDERAGQGQQGDERAEGERLDAGQTDVVDAGQRDGGADDGKQDVEQVAHVADDRHGDVAPGVRFGGRLEEFLVLLVEGLLGGVFMVEDLDDLLAVDGFLHEGVHVADPLLLLDKVAAGAAHDLAHDEVEQNGEHDYERGEWNGQPQHGQQRRDRGDNRGEHLRERLRDGLAQRIGVVGVVAHDVAVLVAVEVADRQLLLVGEHVVTNLLERALLDGDDQPLPQPGRHDAGHIQARHQADGPQQRGPVGVRLPHHRQDVRVDERLEEQRGTGLRGGTDQDAHHDGDDTPLVLEDVAEDALDGARLGFAHGGLAVLETLVVAHRASPSLVSAALASAALVSAVGMVTVTVTVSDGSAVDDSAACSAAASSSGWAWFLVWDS